MLAADGWSGGVDWPKFSRPVLHPGVGEGSGDGTLADSKGVPQTSHSSISG